MGASPTKHAVYTDCIVLRSTSELNHSAIICSWSEGSRSLPHPSEDTLTMGQCFPGLGGREVLELFWGWSYSF